MVFVTGATGLVGRYLADELLRNGEQVRALCRPQSDRQAVHAFLAKAGTDDAQPGMGRRQFARRAVPRGGYGGCQRVFHCAAMVSFHPKDAETMMRINRDATGLLVNAMLHTGVEELVHAVALRRWAASPANPFTKMCRSRTGGMSQYARSKFAAELETWRGQEEGLRVLAVNPVIVLGRGIFRAVLPSFSPLVHRGTQLVPHRTNGFVAARDVARACTVLSDQGCWGERFVLCAENASYRQLMVWMAEALACLRRAAR